MSMFDVPTLGTVWKHKLTGFEVQISAIRPSGIVFNGTKVQFNKTLSRKTFLRMYHRVYEPGKGTNWPLSR